MPSPHARSQELGPLLEGDLEAAPIGPSPEGRAGSGDSADYPPRHTECPLKLLR